MSTDDESFHPLGSEWEGELETMLDETEYDTDLGLEMAKDAMRVTKGELSEADFHEKYHDDVMEEFGEDQRPTKEAYKTAQEEAKGALSRAVGKFDGDGEESRREAMKKMGVGAAAVGLGAWGTAEGGQPSVAEADGESGAHTEAQDVHDRDVQWGMTIDLERCDGCLTCMTACASENDLDQGVNWMYVMAFEDDLTSGGSPAPEVVGGTSDHNMLVRPCQHCTDAPCEKVCPTTARHTRDKDGLVLTDYDVCIGCRYCQVACPYGVNYFQWDEPDVAHEDITGYGGAEAESPSEITHAEYGDSERWVDSRAPRGTMSKCTMCPSMQDGKQGEDRVGTTACEQACPPNAIQFGNVKDEGSDASQHRDHPSKSRTVIDTYHSVPSPTEIEEALGDDADLQSALDALDIERELVSTMKAIQITSEGLDPGEEENNSILEGEQTILESVAALEEYVDLESEETLAELRLGDGSEEDANARLREYAGNPTAKFKLLEDIGTHPNITYIGQKPGPEAEQVDGPVAYGEVGYQRSDDSEPNLVDNRKEILDEGTVGDTGWSL